jgi:hypothetical protein
MANIGLNIHKLYLCNKKKCGENHDCKECHLTMDVEYSKNGDFKYSIYKDNNDEYYISVPDNIRPVMDNNEIFLIEQEVKA